MREFKERENYVIKVDGELVKVSREVYETYHRMERRERYLVERDQDNSLILFSTLRAEDSSTDVPIKDSGVDVEEEVIQKIFLDKLPKALALLTDDEIESDISAVNDEQFAYDEETLALMEKLDNDPNWTRIIFEN